MRRILLAAAALASTLAWAGEPVFTPSYAAGATYFAGYDANDAPASRTAWIAVAR